MARSSLWNTLLGRPEPAAPVRIEPGIRWIKQGNDYVSRQYPNVFIRKSFVPRTGTVRWAVWHRPSWAEPGSENMMGEWRSFSYAETCATHLILEEQR